MTMAEFCEVMGIKPIGGAQDVSDASGSAK